LGPYIAAKGFSLLPTPQASDAAQGAISWDLKSIVPDTRGFPRRIHAATGGTFSVGLARLTLLSVFQPLIPQLVEELMGFPDDWTALELSGTPSFLESENGSDEGLFVQ